MGYIVNCGKGTHYYFVRKGDGCVLLLFKLRFLYFGGVFNKTVIPLALFGYEMMKAPLALVGYLSFLVQRALLDSANDWQKRTMIFICHFI